MKQLHKKIILKGDIVIKTGLHIGGTNSQLGIGGPDNMVVRNPLSNKPIIPGSSLKGKMRALLELTKGKYAKNGSTGNDPEITALFGSSAGDNGHASRLVVRDAELFADPNDRNWDNTDMLYTESKTEVTINRLTSMANPRTFERVPAGAVFNFEMVINVVSDSETVEEQANTLSKLLNEGLALLEEDYIGGNGSRGYGKIEFKNLTAEDLNMSDMSKSQSKQANYFENFK